MKSSFEELGETSIITSDSPVIGILIPPPLNETKEERLAREAKEYEKEAKEYKNEIKMKWNLKLMWGAKNFDETWIRKPEKEENKLSSNDKLLPQIYTKMGGPYPIDMYINHSGMYQLGIDDEFYNQDDRYNILHDDRWLGTARNYFFCRSEENSLIQCQNQYIQNLMELKNGLETALRKALNLDERDLKNQYKDECPVISNCMSEEKNVCEYCICNYTDEIEMKTAACIKRPEAIRLLSFEKEVFNSKSQNKFYTIVENILKMSS